MSDVPKTLERIDLKATTIEILDDILSQIKKEETDPVDLIYLTNFGMIEGKCVFINEVEEQREKTTFESMLIKMTEFRKDELVKLENEYKDLRAVNDSAFIIIKDASITPYALPGSRHQIREMILFTDQIVGLSVGQLSK